MEPPFSCRRPDHRFFWLRREASCTSFISILKAGSASRALESAASARKFPADRVRSSATGRFFAPLMASIFTASFFCRAGRNPARNVPRSIFLHGGLDAPDAPRLALHVLLLQFLRDEPVSRQPGYSWWLLNYRSGIGYGRDFREAPAARDAAPASIRTS